MRIDITIRSGGRRAGFEHYRVWLQSIAQRSFTIHGGFANISSADPVVMPQATGLSIEDLEARGWECQPRLRSHRAACSHPNQLHPVLLPGPPPPPDRPDSITLLVFENGAFLGAV